MRAITAALVLAGALVASIAVGTRHDDRHSAAQQTARVTYVLDGDTLNVDLDGTARRIRLLGINAPEIDHPGRVGQCFGQQARTELRRLAPRGTQILLTADPAAADQDSYGRLLRYVSIRGVDVQEALLREGYAWARPSTPRVARADRYVDVAGTAQKRRVGMWRDCADIS
ncbi:micrococcal nuclease [Branchiibius hedensis]|uniref:Micrococcal nuclease n=1 Tax=Branchiibius hedensis TaxID=672460 RepID=A0A2Y9C6Y0_9MICO|nr:thermonuclease family protein [Branchiibius hedensis]PWJ23346.1 micrococcal nuclease [Branchiibius hedensis]SSA59035.1 micrococcal nuclease [Branchiibius hedensis]